MLRKCSFLLVLLFLGACTTTASTDKTTKVSENRNLTPSISTEQPEVEMLISPTFSANPSTPSPTPTPNPFSDLYNCEMTLKFTSGPLESRETRFTVLSKDYFRDKGDLFGPGKGTSIYYQEQHYFIIHSSYVNGNMLNPMEAEFIRKYLEDWGDTEPDFIRGQMDALKGSEAIWVCSGEQVFLTRINGIVRLSHEASNRLWLEPRSLTQIIEDQEGLASEWIGEFENFDNPAIYIGFCGWGDSSLGDLRFSYYRYLIQFEVVHIYPNP